MVPAKVTQQVHRILTELVEKAARQLGHADVSSAHYLLAILDSDGSLARDILLQFAPSEDVLRKAILASLPPESTQRPDLHLNYLPETKKLMADAYSAALQRGDESMGAEHLLLGLVGKSQSGTKGTLSSVGIEESKVTRELERRLGKKVRTLPHREKNLSQGEFIDRVLYFMHVPGGEAIAGTVVSDQPSTHRSRWHDVIILIHEDQDLDVVFDGLQKTVPALAEYPVLFKLPGKKPVRKDGDNWKTDEYGPDVFSH